MRALKRAATLAMLLATTIAMGAAMAATTAAAQDKLTLQLKWLPDAQAAGYYVALDRGFYRAAGLDVTLVPSGPNDDRAGALTAGRADLIVEWMPAALAARERGIPLVNIAQIFQRSGMELTCRRDSGVRVPADLRGKTLGVWFGGEEYPFLAWMAKLGYRTDGRPGGVTVISQGTDVAPLLNRQAACISTMSYNEYWLVVDGGLAERDLVVFKYEDLGVATLEDGIYALEKDLADPRRVAVLARFLRASLKGWDEAVKHPRMALASVLKYVPGGASAPHQDRMMGEVAKLVKKGRPQDLGYLDPAAYERTVRVLMADRTHPVIHHRPEGAWSHEVWDKAMK